MWRWNWLCFHHPRPEQSPSMGYPFCDCVAAHYHTKFIDSRAMGGWREEKNGAGSPGDGRVNSAHLGIDGQQDRHGATANFSLLLYSSRLLVIK